ncbi:unnamed protein product [Symbiodinium natans]|uniref:Uncharacterized protein n=1 Tax=Symbiodinium natans TaxID=878477 RepID=A0A812JLE1_9DINO|nr:unnamed protein product [Symbiodinium natans]
MDQLEWTTSDLPYFGNVAFAGPFSIQQARRAGFYSPDNPPEVGDQVVCFQRGANWQRRGQVEDISETVSEGSGLRKGHEGMLVTLSTGTGSFTCWSAFLAPVNDKEYSSLCTTHGLLSSHFASLYPCSKGVGDVEFVSKEAARWSLEKWLSNLEDADGEPFEIDASKLQSLLELFDSHQDASLYLYTTHQKLGQRVTLNTGQDYSLYYRALNNTLNCDARSNLENAMPLIQRMVYLLLYDEENGSKRIHEGGRVWKGDTQRPVPLNMQKLREAMRLDRFVRFRQFQSTTREKTLAEKYRAREDGKGYLWTIDIPPGFWGARDIQDPYPLMCEDISWKEKESETLFPPYSAFRVQSLDESGCHLLAVVALPRTKYSIVEPSSSVEQRDTACVDQQWSFLSTKTSDFLPGTDFLYMMDAYQLHMQPSPRGSSGSHALPDGLTRFVILVRCADEGVVDSKRRGDHWQRNRRRSLNCTERVIAQNGSAAFGNISRGLQVGVGFRDLRSLQALVYPDPEFSHSHTRKMLSFIRC